MALDTPIDVSVCPSKSFAAPADQVGAINIKRWGQAGLRLAPTQAHKKRPALISRKPRETPGLDPSLLIPASAEPHALMQSGQTSTS